MSGRRTASSAAAWLAGSVLLFSGLPSVVGQDDGGDNAAGIYIDAAGVVQPVLARGRSETLDQKRLAEAAARDLSPDLNKSSELRKVSLVKLEAAYAQLAAKGASIPKDLFYVAGLQRIDYVFIYPESQDIVIAGPAEGFAPNSIGRTVGVSTGRPPLRIDDLILAFRAASERQPVRCSIDPTPENLAALQKYIAANSNPVTASVAKSRYDDMAEVLDMEKVSVSGVPGDSHFAQTLVEADYRMKRIAMALEPSGVRGLRSHLSMLQPEGNSVQRWWLAPLYEAIVTTEDRNAYEIVGQRVQMMAQEEIADAAGNRSRAATTRMTTQKYAQQFTEKFPELAEKCPVYAELQNLFDLLIVAALLQKDGLSDKVGWKAATFLDESLTSYPRSHVPRQVASVANSRRANRGMVLGLVGGGVIINAARTLESVEFKVEPERRLDGRRTGAVTSSTDGKQRWWWD